jgi:sporulation protein YlmC with PRC-barrel domain
MASGSSENAVDVSVIALSDWQYDDLYRDGWSARSMIDEAEVYGPNGDEIGTVENIIVGPEGRILSIIAQVGGFWDIGDTHVNVPWDQVDVGDNWRVDIPITEDTAEDYSLYTDEVLTTSEAEETIREVDDDLITARPWKATQLMDDYARLADGTLYGYVNDVIFDNKGQLAAVVATPDTRFGAGGLSGVSFPRVWIRFQSTGRIL